MSPETLILVIVIGALIALVLFLITRGSRARDGARSGGHPTHAIGESTGISAFEVAAMSGAHHVSDSHRQRDQHHTYEGSSDSPGHHDLDVDGSGFDSGGGADGGSGSDGGGGDAGCGDGGGGSSGSD